MRCLSAKGCDGDRREVVFNVTLERYHVVARYKGLKCDSCGDLTAFPDHREHNQNVFDSIYESLNAYAEN